MKDEFYFPSKDGNTEIHTIEWKPQGAVKAVLQISHGMVEYVGRYSEFAEYLCDRGFYVVGNDHLGHGKSVQSKSEYGYFDEKYGNTCILGDMHTLRQRTMKKYPGIPYFMLGHSMGSTMLRQYIQLYGNGLSGAVIMGSVADRNTEMLRLARLLCRVLALFKGWHYRSRMIDGMVNDPFCRKFKPARTRADWVTSDTQRLDAYVADPLCSFVFTVNAYYHLFGGILQSQKKENIAMIPKMMPILIVSGAQDPVGKFGKGVSKIYEKYKAAGISDISMKLYAGDRHELLNETDREQVYRDLYEWMASKVK